MKLRKLRSLVPFRLMQTQGIPDFRGRESRTHRNAAVWRLQAEGAAAALQHRARLSQVHTLVQFAGFPRSGHSLIGSILDAHPDARVSHELDVMGLVHHHLPMRSILGLIDQKALEFSYHGRYWNGYCYYVERGAHLEDRPPRVMGDKKGDMAVRRIARSPGLLKRLEKSGDLRKKWICVLRNPFDNIATMSLRATRLYDTLRAQSGSSADFSQRLKKAQDQGDITSHPLSSQIGEYERLCEAVARIQKATPSSDWFELSHEAFSAAPETHIEALLDFLRLDKDAEYITHCASLVHQSANRSGDLLHWSASELARVQTLISKFSFLECYRDDFSIDS